MGQVGTDRWKSVSAGGYHVLAMKEDGSLWAWGAGNEGALGIGSLENKSVPAPVGEGAWVAMAAGHKFSVGLRADEAALLWGNLEFRREPGAPPVPIALTPVPMDPTMPMPALVPPQVVTPVAKISPPAADTLGPRKDSAMASGTQVVPPASPSPGSQPPEGLAAGVLAIPVPGAETVAGASTTAATTATTAATTATTAATGGTGAAGASTSLLQSSLGWLAANPVWAIAGGAALVVGGAAVTTAILADGPGTSSEPDLGMPPADPVRKEAP
jgi:hypothetical protein